MGAHWRADLRYTREKDDSLSHRDQGPSLRRRYRKRSGRLPRTWRLVGTFLPIATTTGNGRLRRNWPFLRRLR